MEVTHSLRLLNDGGWPELAIVLICGGGILVCYGAAFMPITSKVRAVATYVPPHYRIATLLNGGMSLFLFGVGFGLLRQAYRGPPNPAWAWVVAALTVLVAGVGTFFALLAWGALSDPKSRLGSWLREKSADTAETMLALLCGEALGWSVVFLSSLAFGYSIYLGVAAILCWGLLLVLLVSVKAQMRRPSPR